MTKFSMRSLERVTVLASMLALSACLTPVEQEDFSDVPGISEADPSGNTAPNIEGSPAVSAKVGSGYSFMPKAADPDGDELVFLVESLPSWSEFDVDTGRLWGTPDGSEMGVYTNIAIGVSDGKAESWLPAFSIKVDDGNSSNSAPTISGTPATKVAVGEAYSFTPVAADDDGDRLQFRIANLPGWAQFDSSTGLLSGNPALADVAIYEGIVISVTDGSARTSLPAFSIEVVDLAQRPGAPAGNSAPTISGTPPEVAEVGAEYEFTPDANDADGDKLRFTIVNRPSWSKFEANTGTLSGFPADGDVGTYDNIVLRVTDGTDTVALPAFSITVLMSQEAENNAPEISGTAIGSATVDERYSFAPVASDADNDELIFSITNRPRWASFNSNNGLLTGVPKQRDVGQYADIVIGVSDGKVQSTLGAFAIEVTAAPNNAPEISGSPRVAIAVGKQYAFSPSASDPDGDALTFSIQNQPSWAQFNPNNGVLSGVPSESNLGVFAGIVISVSDGQESVSLPSFAITVSEAEDENSAPSISGSPRRSVSVDTSYNFVPTASDPDGDDLTFTIQNTPSWASFDSDTGRLYGTPGDTNVGTTSGIVISVSDGTESASLAPFSIEVLEAENSAPTITGAPASTVEVNERYDFTPSASDADGDDLTFTIDRRPSWLNFNSNTGRVSGTPRAAHVGTHTGIVISVSDGSEISSLPAFSIEVTEGANSPPEISGAPRTTVETGQSYSFTPTASDPDGDALSFSIRNQPDWAGFNANNGRLSGTPTSADVGVYADIVITASDGQIDTDLAGFSIEVLAAANAAPEISGTPRSEIDAGDSYVFAPTASDADGDTLTFSIQNKPDWLSFNNATGRLSGTPAAADVGVYSNIRISVSDGVESASLPAFAIEVVDVGSRSVTLSWTPPTENEDGSAITGLSAYKIYYGTSQGSYPNEIRINNVSVTTYTVPDLTASTYYFVVTAINTDGVESEFSNSAAATP